MRPALLGWRWALCATQMHRGDGRIVKSVMRFRQFPLRGLAHVKGELNLGAMAWNVKLRFVLAGSLKAATA